MGTIAKYLITALAGIAVGVLLAMLFVPGETDGKADVTTKTMYDTIPYYEPVPVDSFIVRYETVRLPAVRDTIRDSIIFTDTIKHDSVNVIVPFTQKKYQDSIFTAWVSGFRPKLDSIKIYRETIYKTIKEKPSRVGIGITGGYGYGLKGFTPFLGLGLYYRLSEF